MTPRPGKAISLFQTQPKTADPPRGPRSSRDPTEARPGAPHDERHARSKNKNNRFPNSQTRSNLATRHLVKPPLLFCIKGTENETARRVQNKSDVRGSFQQKKRNRNQKTKNPVSKMCISFEPHPLLLRHESTTQSKTSACKTHGAFDTKPPTRSLCEPTSSMPSATPP